MFTGTWSSLNNSCNCTIFVILKFELNALVFSIFNRFVPESPRWLVSSGKLEKAEAGIREIAAVNKGRLPDAFKISDIQCVSSNQFTKWLQNIWHSMCIIHDFTFCMKWSRFLYSCSWCITFCRWMSFWKAKSGIACTNSLGSVDFYYINKAFSQWMKM